MKTGPAFFISSIFHICFFFLFCLTKEDKIIYVSLPVEIIPYTIQEVKKDEKEIKKDEIIIKKKEKKKPKKITTKTETQPPTPKSQIPPTFSLQVSKFPFTYYLSLIKRRVRENWEEFFRSTGYYKTVVYFKIMKDGEIKNLKIKEHSGDSNFDFQAMSAIERANPFPPLPEIYKEDFLEVYFEFCFTN